MAALGEQGALPEQAIAQVRHRRRWLAEGGRDVATCHATLVAVRRAGPGRRRTRSRCRTARGAGRTARSSGRRPAPASRPRRARERPPAEDGAVEGTRPGRVDDLEGEVGRVAGPASVGRWRGVGVGEHLVQPDARSLAPRALRAAPVATGWYRSARDRRRSDRHLHAEGRLGRIPATGDGSSSSGYSQPKLQPRMAATYVGGRAAADPRQRTQARHCRRRRPPHVQPIPFAMRTSTTDS